jgi:ubiquinone/menaquinone biosynthesis C-methylase UbiE
MISSTHRVNYDLIAHLYDEPGRDYEPDQNLVDFLNERTDHHYSSIRILDLGCGTGKQLTANHNHFPRVQMIGLDLFHGMLEQARNRCPGIPWVQGDSAKPPFANSSFDYITNQFSYHHVQDKNRMVTSIFRILKPNGRFVITNLDPWSMPEWIVYTYFQASRERDLSDFVPVEELTSLMQTKGFHNIRVKYSHKRSVVELKDFLAYASQRHRTSQLMAIQDEDYELGIAKLKANVAKLGMDSRVTSEICLVWIAGDKPR